MRSRRGPPSVGRTGDASGLRAGPGRRRVDQLEPPGRARAGWAASRAGPFARAYNAKVGLALLCPITGQIKGYPFEVLIPAGLPVSGAILADQVKSLDWPARRADLIVALPGQVVDAVLARVRTLL